MLYEYECNSCKRRHELHRPAAQFNDPAICPACQSDDSQLVIGTPEFAGAKVEDAEYNPGLGCVTRNKAHRQEIAKRKGLVEIGNETPDNMIKTAIADRERKAARSWDEC